MPRVGDGRAHFLLPGRQEGPRPPQRGSWRQGEAAASQSGGLVVRASRSAWWRREGHVCLVEAAG